MAEYGRVARRFWTDPKVRGWDTDTRHLALYLLTSPHGSMEGYYRLSIAYAADDLGWSTKKVKAGMDRLQEEGFIVYDSDASVVLIPKALSYQSPSTENHMKGAKAVLDELPPNLLYHLFLEAAREHAPRFHHHIAMPSPMEPPWHSNGMGDAIADSSEGDEASHSNTPAPAPAPAPAQTPTPATQSKIDNNSRPDPYPGFACSAEEFDETHAVLCDAGVSVVVAAQWAKRTPAWVAQRWVEIGRESSSVRDLPAFVVGKLKAGEVPPVGAER